MGEKIPEHLRPPWREISQKFSSVVPRKLERMLVPDLQNDCGCPTESYELDGEGWHQACWLGENGKPKNWDIRSGGRVCLPMHPEITIETIEEVIRYGFRLAKSELPTCCDLTLSNVIKEANEEYLNVPMAVVDKSVSKRGWYRNVYSMDLQEMADSIFVTPDPEYFGVITLNLRGFGMFFMPGHAIRIPLTDDIRKLFRL